MAFPTLLTLLGFITSITLVYLLSHILKIRPESIKIENPRKEAHLSLAVYIGVFITASAMNALWNVLKVSQTPPFDVYDALRFVFFYTLFSIPLIAAMRRTGQTLESIGVTSRYGCRMLVFALTSSAILFTVYGLSAAYMGLHFAGFSTPLAYGIIAYSINSFAEEIVFRGYIQTRLIAYFGTAEGFIITLLFFTALHIPRFFFFSGAANQFTWNVLLNLFPAVLFGFTMIKSQNIAIPLTFHLLWNLNTILWVF